MSVKKEEVLRLGLKLSQHSGRQNSDVKARLDYRMSSKFAEGSAVFIIAPRRQRLTEL